MATNNSTNTNATGLVKYDGAGTFTGVTVTQYNTLVGAASNGISSISPGNSGQVLTSNGASSNPSFQDASGGSGLPISLDDEVAFIDYFWGISPTFMLGWASNLNGGSVGAIASESSHYGIAQVTTSSSATGAAFFRLGASEVYLGTDVTSFFFEAKIPTLSDGTETFTVDFGVADIVTAAGAIVDGIYWTYTHGTNSGNWVINCTKDSATTSGNTSTAADTNWHIYEIRTNAASTSVGFYVDGVQVANSPIATNIPNDGASSIMQPYFRITKSNGTTLRNFLMDTFKTVITYTTPHTGG